MGSYYFYDLTENLSSSCGLIFVKRVEGSGDYRWQAIYDRGGRLGWFTLRECVPAWEVGFKGSSVGVTD